MDELSGLFIRVCLIFYFDKLRGYLNKASRKKFSLFGKTRRRRNRNRKDETAMKEKLYTIPVNDAFRAGDECPICRIRTSLTNNAVEFTMGPSYMEDDVRMETDRIGFCGRHIRLLYGNQNRLGLALMLKTHMDRTISDLERLCAQDSGARHPPSGLFRKKSQPTAAEPVQSYIKALNTSCFICNRIEEMYGRYLATVFYLYKNDDAFRNTFRTGKGFCTDHFGVLRAMAPEELSGTLLTDFLSDLDRLYLENMKRVRDDLEWFTDKFDYRNADAPWKNSKDALPRTITKTNGILDELD